MSTISHPRGNAIIRWPHALTIWILGILIALGLLLDIRAALNALESPGGDAYQADWVPAAQIQVVPIPAPLAPAPAVTILAVSTPAAFSPTGKTPAIIPVPVPTPPPAARKPPSGPDRR